MTVPSPRHDPTRHDRRVLSGDVWSSPQKADQVLRWLADQPLEDGEIVASLRGIADGTGISLPTVRRAVRRLLDGGQLILARRGTGYPYSSRYRLADTNAMRPSSVA